MMAAYTGAMNGIIPTITSKSPAISSISRLSNINSGLYIRIDKNMTAFLWSIYTTHLPSIEVS